ncbi:carnitine O-acetyltransferase-like isoform X2 [Centropristis striata]|uniref:carnitine O-acetyltransferase-like isoform X2 n=1 Tax=Centropristis striata TaxID=184440 RepID=UPI0027DF7853|nr:carnitine O-acetyltransferase-like isoform X2 [Centropristis striata]
MVQMRMVKPVSVTRVAGRNLTQNLPKMPVPPLQRACEVYLSCLETIVEEDELKRSKELVEEFQKAGGVGERLQRGLEEFAENTENWFTEQWEEHLFLADRHPQILHAGCGIVFPRMHFINKEEQIRHAAELISVALELKTLIDNDKLPVEHMKGRPMCMDQFKRLWSSCRVPAPMMDTLEVYSKNPDPPKHITVAHNCQFFMLDVYNSDGTPLTADQLYVQLQKICISSPQTNTEPVGILTTENRDLWSKTYSNLMQDETNKESLQAIKSSLFTVCLDQATPEVSEDMYHSSAVLHGIHGGGSQLNSGNRWFDKSMQLYVGAKGTCGMTFPFAAVDGMVVVATGDFIAEYLKREKPDVVQSPMEPLPEPQKLQFNLTPEIKEDIEEAKQHLDTLTQEVFFKSTVFKHYGKDALHALKVDHTSYIQMAFQLAYYRTYQRVCVTVQPASLRYYHRGRLNVVPCNTAASTAFTKAFDDPNKQISEKMDLLEKAIQTNRTNIHMAVNSQYLFGHMPILMFRALKEEAPLCDVFTDPNFMKTYNIQLVPSNISSRTDGFLQFHAPSEPGVFEILYDIQKDHLKMTVTNYKEDNTDVMIQATEDALLDMMTLLEQSSGAKETANPDTEQ